MMATLRSTAISLLRLDGHASTAAALQFCGKERCLASLLFTSDDGRARRSPAALPLLARHPDRSERTDSPTRSRKIPPITSVSLPRAALTPHILCHIGSSGTCPSRSQSLQELWSLLRRRHLCGDFAEQLPHSQFQHPVLPRTRKTGGHNLFRVCDLRSVRFVNRSLCADTDHRSTH